MDKACCLVMSFENLSVDSCEKLYERLKIIVKEWGIKRVYFVDAGSFLGFLTRLRREVGVLLYDFCEPKDYFAYNDNMFVKFKKRAPNIDAFAAMINSCDIAVFGGGVKGEKQYKDFAKKLCKDIIDI